MAHERIACHACTHEKVGEKKVEPCLPGV